MADLDFNRVYVWNELQSALDGEQADALLGASNWDDVDPDTAQNGLFWPLRLAFDGSTLFVSEYKFSGRVLSYSYAPIKNDP